MEKEKASRAAWSGGAIVVLVAALGLGLGIKKIRTWRAEAEPEAKNVVQAKPAAEEFEAEVGEPVVEAVEEEQVAVAEPIGEVETETKETAQEDVPEVESVQDRAQMQMARGLGNWQQMWADLNLTPEEMARLREGFALAMERWRNMPEEERQAQMARFRGMRGQWESMSDEERQGAMERMRGRFDDWRASGEVELPEMTLD
ncbi:MAG: hypothetical protein ISS79_09655 [Phycisphaerae bacterium]|nr:hypothetical protein [Phycisphaerae bacterium]